MTEDRDLPIIMMGKKYPHRLDDQVRDVVYNVYCFFTKEAKEFGLVKGGYFSSVLRRVAAATGVSTSFVSNLVNEYEDMGPEAFLKPILRNPHRASKRLKKKAKATKRKQQQMFHPTFLNEMNTHETFNMQYEKFDDFENKIPAQNFVEVKIEDETDVTENALLQNNSYLHYFDKNIFQQTLENMKELEATSVKIKTEGDTCFHFEGSPVVNESGLVKVKDEPETVDLKPDIVESEPLNKNDISYPFVLQHQPSTSCNFKNAFQ